MMTEELLKKYARGEAGEAEKQAVRRYLANHFESMFDVLEEMRRVTKQQLIDEVRRQLAQSPDAKTERRLKALTGSDPVDELRRLSEERRPLGADRCASYVQGAVSGVSDSARRRPAMPRRLLRSVLLRLMMEEE